MKERGGKKIAYILGSLNRGGLETLALDVFNNANTIGIELIGIHRKKGVLYEAFYKTGIPFFEIGLRHRLDFTYFFKMRRLLIKEQISIAHCHQPIDALLVYLATIGLKIKILLTIHSNGPEDSPIRNTLKRFLFWKVNKVLFVSNFTKNIYFQKFRLWDSSKLQVLYNGIDFAKFQQPSNCNIRTELSIQKKTLLLGSVGNFTSGRDQLTVCRFLNLLRLQKNDFIFLFIGEKSEAEPELYNSCIEYCNKHDLNRNVTFLGMRNDVPAILTQLDAFVYSTVHDTFGIAVIEAMYVGTPVFLNDWEVMKEITDNGKYANIYRSGDENDLLQTFNPFLKNKNEYEQKAKLARIFVEKNYCIQSHLQLLKKIYQLEL